MSADDEPQQDPQQRAGGAGALPGSPRVALVTVSDTRTAANDAGGDLAVALLAGAGAIVVSRHLVPDDEETIRALAQTLLTGGEVDVVLLTGGTGVSQRDRTVEAVTPLLARRLDGYGELFRMLSFAEIGAAAMLSRAVAGVALDGVLLFTMPGSPAGVRLALERLIVPEMAHLLAEVRRGPAEAHGRRGHHQHRDHHHHEHDDRAAEGIGGDIGGDAAASPTKAGHGHRHRP